MHSKLWAHMDAATAATMAISAMYHLDCELWSQVCKRAKLVLPLIKEILKHHDSATGRQPQLVLLHGQMNNITTSRETTGSRNHASCFQPSAVKLSILSPSRTFHDLSMPIPVSFIKQLLWRSECTLLCQVSLSSDQLLQLLQLKDPKSASHLSLYLISSSLAVIQFNPMFHVF